MLCSCQTVSQGLRLYYALIGASLRSLGYELLCGEMGKSAAAAAGAGTETFMF